MIDGERLRAARRARDLTQTELAELVGISMKSIAAYERGIRDPGTETVAKMAEVLGVTSDHLMGAEEQRQPTRIPVLGRIPAGIPLEAIEEVRRRKARLLDLYATEAALTPSDLSARINPLSEQEGRLQGEIEALRASSGVDEKKAATLVATFADVIASGDPARIRTLVESLIDRIDLDGSQLTIRWRF